ncbi:MAG: hypothetical protein ABJK20_05985 [Halieaceae bacterium]
MRALSTLGIPVTLISVASVSTLLLLAVRQIPLYVQGPHKPVTLHQSLPLNRPEKVLALLCLGLLASRGIAIGLEVYLRPVWAWDSMQHWTKQAKVFFEMRGVVPYVSIENWLELGGNGVYTNMHPDYPIATPLLQAWTAIVLGYWHSSLVNLLWPAMWLAIGLVFYSQARVAGANITVALAATYMILSMPLLNTHAALAGYADLLMSACYLGAVAAFYNWSQTRAPWLLTLSLMTGTSCLLIKNEGFYWFLTLLPGILLATAKHRAIMAWLAAGALGFMVFLYAVYPDLSVAGHSLADFDIFYRPDSWIPIYLSTLVHDNWHLLFYLFLATLLTTPFLGKKVMPILAVVLSAVALYLMLYVMTSNSAGAVQFTSLNRVALQLAPSLGFFTLIAYLALSDKKNISEAS